MNKTGVGASVIKPDALHKVTGRALFAADITRPGMLVGKVLRSKVPHAIIESIDILEASKFPGVVKILTADDIPGPNGVGIIIKDEPVLSKDKIRRIGDALALVAAETEEAADAALQLIRVVIKEIPAVFDSVEAMLPNAPLVHNNNNNVLNVRKIRKGDVEAGFAAADVIVENRYLTQRVEHAYIEPEAGVAEYDGSMVTMWVSTQNTHFDRKEVARTLGIGVNRVRVIQAVTGGGFGGKLDISVQCYLALLAYYTGRAVKMVYTREESMISSGKRHPYIIDYKTGATKDGKLIAVKITIIGDTGAYASYGPAVLTRAAVHATGPYEVPNVYADAYTVYTNNPMAGAMRGFGIAQMAFAHESQMDQLAEKLGISPVEIRLINCLRPGSVTTTGQVLQHSVGILATIEQASGQAQTICENCWEWGDKSMKKRGLGIGCMWYGIGNTGLPNPAGAVVDWLDDASVNLMVGCADIGQGSDTVLAQIVAEELGISYENVTVVSADTMVTPDGGASSASRQTYISGNAVRLAAIEAKKIPLEEAGIMLKQDRANLTFKDGMVWANGQPTGVTVKAVLASCRMKGKLTLGSGWFNPETTGLDLETGYSSPYATYAFATQVVEVEVNTGTGQVEVLKIIAAHDLGRAINPVLVEGQIEGGTSMGVGYALMEEVITARGKIQNPNFSGYLIPTVLDVPEVTSILIEDAEPTGPFGAKGVGEPSLIPTAAAIANAVFNAIGVRIFSLPITPEKVLSALTEKKAQS